MAAIKDDRGFNQIFEQSRGNLVRLQRRADWMVQQMDVAPAKKLLEIGCGTGFMAHHIAQQTKMEVLGADLCAPFIKEARAAYQLPNLSFEVLDFNKAADSIHNQFNYIVGNGILHHLYHNLDDVFITFKNLLLPGGKIIFMEPNIYNPYVAAIFKNKYLRKLTSLEPDEMAFSKQFIQRKLEKASFSNIHVQYKDFLLPGLPDALIKPFIVIGNVLEKTPARIISQSILITASKEKTNPASA
ncbi:MAG TPA: class I SAM-dependent methyltransferase [Chitinophagaceae bacterium]|nr:class I SAM-dependent methyltransferase [Chitinophagaceae bacterium]